MRQEETEMKKMYDKDALNFALLWIGIYVVAMGAADRISERIGILKVVTVPVCVVLTGVLWRWIHSNDLAEEFGLCKVRGAWRRYLYFIPLVLLASTNAWYGLQRNFSWVQSTLCVISMVCVGFLEEIIFRGFLFRALCRTNVRQAVVISGVSFGLGHVVNLLGGQGTAETAMQICYAAAIGLLFAVLFYRGKSLWPCILTHSATNVLSIFAKEDTATVGNGVGMCVFICAVCTGYMVFLLKQTDGT